MTERYRAMSTANDRFAIGLDMEWRDRIQLNELSNHGFLPAGTLRPPEPHETEAGARGHEE